MSAKTYLSMVLAVCMGVVSVPLWAQIISPPEEPANIIVPAVSPEEHAAVADLHKEYEVHHKAMAEQNKSVAKAYEKAGQGSLKTHHEELAKHHEALAKEHAKIAETHESMARTKNK